MKNFLTKMRTIYNRYNFFSKNDPMESCELYKAEGCSHVDGYMCDYPSCTMNKEYLESLKPAGGLYKD